MTARRVWEWAAFQRRFSLGKQVFGHATPLRSGFREDLGAGEKIVFLDAGVLAGTVGKHAYGFEAAAGFTPPDAIIGLRELGFLTKIQDRQKHQSYRSYGQEDCLNAV
jgi:hypothetical protein